MTCFFIPRSTLAFSASAAAMASRDFFHLKKSMEQNVEWNLVIKDPRVVWGPSKNHSKFVRDKQGISPFRSQFAKKKAAVFALTLASETTPSSHHKTQNKSSVVWAAWFSQPEQGVSRCPESHADGLILE